MTSLLGSALAPKSVSSYARAWERFRSTLAKLGISSVSTSLPVPPHLVALFIADLFNQGLAPATITSAISALSYSHKVLGHPDPGKTFFIQKILQGVVRESGRAPDARLPITYHILGRLVEAVNHTAPSHYCKMLFQAMFILAFHAFLRSSEMCGSQHTLTLQQVQLSDLSGTSFLTVTFLDFKHSDGRPFSLQIQAREPASLCPVRSLQRYLQVRGLCPGPLFCLPGSIPISHNFFADQLRVNLRYCKLNTELYKSHSFRIGAATHALSQGFSDAAIQTLGRWHSDAFKKYLRSSSVCTM